MFRKLFKKAEPETEEVDVMKDEEGEKNAKYKDAYIALQRIQMAMNSQTEQKKLAFAKVHLDEFFTKHPQLITPHTYRLKDSKVPTYVEAWKSGEGEIPDFLTSTPSVHIEEVTALESDYSSDTKTIVVEENFETLKPFYKMTQGNTIFHFGRGVFVCKQPDDTVTIHTSSYFHTTFEDIDIQKED